MPRGASGSAGLSVGEKDPRRYDGNLQRRIVSRVSLEVRRIAVRASVRRTNPNIRETAKGDASARDGAWQPLPHRSRLRRGGKHSSDAAPPPTSTAACALSRGKSAHLVRQPARRRAPVGFGAAASAGGELPPLPDGMFSDARPAPMVPGNNRRLSLDLDRLGAGESNRWTALKDRLDAEAAHQLQQRDLRVAG